MQYKNVLVAINGGDISKLILKEAFKLAIEQPTVFLRIIHIIDTFFVNWSMQPRHVINTVDFIINSGQEILNNAESEARSAGIHNMETKLIKLKRGENRIDEKIVEEAQSWPAQMIIMGSHKGGILHNFRRIIFSNITEKVKRNTSVPVVLVQEK